LSFVVLPLFWQTWWFVSLMVAASLGAVGGVARYATRRRMQRKLERLEQQNALERERARIARDMHDELGAKLTRISFQGATASRNLADPAQARQHIAKMSETARELVASLDQIVWAVDPENDSLDNLANYICRYASDFVESSAIQCELVIPTELPHHRLSTEVRHNVFLAVKEALNNALKHSGATRVILAIAVRHGEVEVRIADNGCGMADARDSAARNERIGRGLANMRERMASIQGRFELDSSPERGTEVRLIVPLSGRRERLSSIHPTRRARP
jgi:signal transduction histidine kinase